MARALSCRAALGLGLWLIAQAPACAQDARFRAFLDGLWPQAQARGVSRSTFDTATAGLEPDPQIISITRRQPEFASPIGKYLANQVSAARLAGGRKALAQHGPVLDALQRRYGVDKFVVLAIWGLETGYGGNTGGKDVIRSLATLTYINYRPDYFRGELLTAMLILQQGHIDRPRMKGSWAGAMGHTQFMPSSFQRFAVDHTGDGKADIWTAIPDALASTANYLKANGWVPGLPWGYEVAVPEGYDLRRSRGSFAEWAARGIRRVDGGALPATGDAILFHPSGIKGPAFLATQNFLSIRSYNNSDAYALSVGQLADLIAGGATFRGPWPEDRPLSREERMIVQRRLAALGYPVKDFEGRIDFDLRDAIREVQFKHRLVPDGNPDETLLRVLQEQASR